VAGEESGVLDSMLEKSTTYYEELVVFDSLTALIEPFIITFLGVVVGSMMVAMYLPIFQMGGAIIG
jgi:type IV pilus assembly protein PilC